MKNLSNEDTGVDKLKKNQRCIMEVCKFLKSNNLNIFGIEFKI